MEENEAAATPLPPIAVLFNDLTSSSANGMDALYASSSARYLKLNDHARISLTAGVQSDTSKQHQQITLIDAIPTSDGKYALAVAMKQQGTAGLTLTVGNKTSTGAASEEVVPANANRKYLIVYMRTANTADLAVGEAAVANKGIFLAVQGSFYEMSSGSGNLSTAAVNGITTGAGAIYSFIEGV